MNKLIFKFLTNKGRIGIQQGRISSANLYTILSSNFAESVDKLSASEKMEKIIKKQADLEKGSEDEIKFFQDKKIPLVKHMNLVRSPIYLSMPFLLWVNPFSQAYTFTLLFSNYYLIFLTVFEGTSFFSLGLNQSNLVVMNSKLDDKEAVLLKDKVTRKRLALMVLFFFFICLSSDLASRFNNTFSTGLIFLSNIYLYFKISYNISLYGLSKRVFERRMKNIGMNALLALFFGFIYWRNDKYVKNNIIYSI